MVERRSNPPPPVPFKVPFYCRTTLACTSLFVLNEVVLFFFGFGTQLFQVHDLTGVGQEIVFGDVTFLNLTVF